MSKYLMLFLAVLLSICNVSERGLFNDPQKDLYIVADEAPQIEIDIEPLDMNSIEIYCNQTHIIINVTLLKDLLEYPLEPEIIDYGYLVYADNNRSRSLFFDVSVDKETGWIMFTSALEESKVSYSYINSILSYSIARDIIDLGGSPEKLMFLVWSMYENPDPIFYRIVDVAPQQEAGWMPNYLGLPSSDWSYFEVNLNDFMQNVSEANSNTEAPVNLTPYILGIGLILIIVAGRKLNVF